MYFISNIFLRIRGGSKSSCTNAIFFALAQELIDRPSYINEQLLEHDSYISCLQLKKVNVAHDAMHNNYLYNHTAYYHVLQQVIAFLVKICSKMLDKLFTYIISFHLKRKLWNVSMSQCARGKLLKYSLFTHNFVLRPLQREH